MATSSIVKNFRDGVITLSDSTSPTPLSLEVKYESGDFALSGVNYSSTGPVDHTKYLDRGELGSIRRTSRMFATGSFSCQMTELSDATNQNIWDIVNRSGAYAAAVSTLGASADLYTLKIQLVVEGSNFGGGEADHTLVLNDCRVSIDFAEGDPNSFTLNFEVLGTITAT